MLYCEKNLKTLIKPSICRFFMTSYESKLVIFALNINYNTIFSKQRRFYIKECCIGGTVYLLHWITSLFNHKKKNKVKLTSRTK